MSDDLRVATAHLRALSARQGQAATEIQAATQVTRGVDTSVRVSHGVIAASTAAAVDAANRAREAAGTSIGRTSAALDDDLGAAGSRYDGTDGCAGDLLGARMRR